MIGAWTFDAQSKEVYGLPKCNPPIVAVNLEILNDIRLKQRKNIKYGI